MKRRAVLMAGLSASLSGTLRASPSLVELIERSKPSVLLIGSYAETDSPRFGFRGSGFVVGDGNLAVTNVHVLPQIDSAGEMAQRRVTVQVPAGRGLWSMRGARIVRLDRSHDLALLRFDGPAVPALQLAAPEAVQEGLAVAFIGFPIGHMLGFAPVTHRGMISSIVPIAQAQRGAQSLNETAIRRLREGSFDVLQLDGTAYPGNSGGPVFDAETGLVVGVINMVLVKGSKESALTHPSGISYAIHCAELQRLLQAL